jgi:hypothetical protein
VRRYRRAGLVAALCAARFRVERAVYVDSLGFAAALVYRFAGDPQGGLDPRAVRLYDALLFPLSRAFDAVLGRAFGKNLLVHARRPEGDGPLRNCSDLGNRTEGPRSFGEDRPRLRTSHR